MIPDDRSGRGLAIAAQALFLANLLVLPVLAFLGLAWLWWRHRQSAGVVGRNHLQQSFLLSLWGGVLLVLINGLIIGLGGYQGAHLWVVVIMYFTLVHSTLVVLGAFALSKAMAGQCWRVPLIGPTLPPDCPKGD